MIIRDIPLRAFSTQYAAEVTGLSTQLLGRWARSGFFVPKWPGDDRRPYTRVYSLVDVFALRTIALLREKKVPFSEIEQVRDCIIEAASQERGNQRFYVVGRKVFCSKDDAQAAARALGAKAAPEIIELAAIRDEVRRNAEQLRVRKPEEIGKVIRTRGTLSGAWRIAGTRIYTALIADLVEEGYSPEEIIAELPRLTPADIEAAVAFERERRGKAKPVSAVA
jgi:uncharacterized protein (DUF433 family)